MFKVDFKEIEQLQIFLEGDLDINTVREFQEDVLNKYKDMDKDIVLILKTLTI